MVDIKTAFGSPTALTITLASLAQAGARESTAVDNSSNKYVDAMVYVQVKLQTGTPGSDKLVNVYAYWSHDGTNYTDNATGSDAAITMRSPTNLRLIGAIQVPDSGALTYKFVIPSVLAFIGGESLPQKWGVVVENRTNVTLSATAGDHKVEYTGLYKTAA
jgi:hypothetical protein